MIDAIFDTAWISDAEIGESGLVDKLEKSVGLDSSSVDDVYDVVIGALEKNGEMLVRKDYFFLYCDRTHHGFFVAKERIPETID